MSHCNFRGHRMDIPGRLPHSATGHPPFQLQRENVRDNDVLRFNHQRHLNSSDIPLVEGKKLDCNYCHKPGSEWSLHATD